MSLVLSVCVLFILLMQSVNGVQFLNTTSLSLLFAPALAAAVFLTDIVLLVCIHHYNHINLVFNLVLNLIWLLVIYVPRESSFIFTQFFYLNLDG